VESRYNNDLASVALAMYKNPDLKLKIVGNCDTKGSITYNIALGNRRADAVKNYLVKKFKVDASRLFTETVGKASTIDGAGSINRRVDLMVKE
jgi:outer membrane protein OmpA-like peptidoglycan-associated protein